MINSGYLLMILSILLVGQSCQRKHTWVYTNHTPTFFEKKNDFEVGGSLSELVQVHAAYAVTDHFGVRISGAFGRRDSFEIFKTNPAGVPFQEKGSSFVKDIEFSAGYSKKVGEKMVFETFGGFAIIDSRTKGTRIDNMTGAETTFTTGEKREYNRVFVQPAIGKVGRFVDYGGGLRFSLINYIDGVTDVMAEPFMFGRFGYEYIKFMTQVNLHIVRSYGTHQYRIWPINFGIGLNFVFHPSIHDTKPVIE